MYQQVFDPVGDSLGLSSIFAAIPIVVLFVLLGGLKMKAHWAALISLAAALIVAIAVYGMPVGQALDTALLGACFGLFPIMWIVWNALWIYNMTVETGHFAVLRRAFNRVSDDQRVQAVIIAFCFGALLEALAGFGTPVAITAVMLIALGFQPMEAATTFRLNRLSAAGTLLLISGLLTMLALKVSPRRALQVYGKTLDQLKWATLTVASVLALA